MVNLELYSVKYNMVQEKAGLNWGFSSGHTCLADAYIALTKDFLKSHANFFPPQGNTIVTKWDDGETINCLLEGTQKINGKTYPKQISSFNDKSILGHYIRKRIGVSDNHLITLSDLNHYGRNYVSITKDKNNTNIYHFDFNPNI